MSRYLVDRAARRATAPLGLTAYEVAEYRGRPIWPWLLLVAAVVLLGAWAR